MPGELALLPIVESAYDPFAYSRGRALGTWQFIAETGRRFGLQQDWWYDGRRDVWAATHAALDYLTYLNQMFDGDWLLALAAYNTGEGRVGRHVRRNASRGEGTDFWSLKLPRETRGYVPKLLGLACLFRNPDPFEFRFPETPNEPVIAAVELPSQADLVLVAQLAEVPIADLFRLNPGFNRWATSPAGPHRVVLPIEAADRARPELAALDSDVLMQWDQVTVERGDTLLRLSERHHVPLDVIRTANGLRGDMIRAGQKLRLPRSEVFVADPLYASAATQLAALQSDLIAADRVTHRVRSGESLSVIARNYRVSVRDLQRWNNISNPNQLRAGQRLVVFHTPATGPSNSQPSQHVVQSGDSLWSISRKYSIGLDDLRRLNNLSRGATIHPGQSLKVSF
ncbi:MAG: LysM peptidoglycan-binding domain-containing protein, partial [Xanthomonadales bacterium]|nr:LysM peptidoglycan-binding domain-containing protein [Xanthomonadales bacterium]